MGLSPHLTSLLSDVALTVLTIPHSNASEERAFSIIGKNKTEFRSTLGVKSLNAIMITKMSLPEELMPCYRWKPSRELLESCKRDCHESNQSSTALLKYETKKKKIE